MVSRSIAHIYDPRPGHRKFMVDKYYSGEGVINSIFYDGCPGSAHKKTVSTFSCSSTVVDPDVGARR